MRKCCLLFLYLLLLHTAQGQASYWQQQVDYVMDVTLNEADGSLDGFQKITYVNHSPDTLTYIFFHTWPNAYKNDQTAFSEGMLSSGNTRFYFSDAKDRGYMNRLQFKVDGVQAQTEDHAEHIDIIKVLLPSPLLPGSSVTITTPFHVQLPRIFSRGGREQDIFQVTQWYPKPAVYDAHGWHPMPYLDGGEFYSEFGTFQVSVTIPKTYVVAASGLMSNEAEMEWMQNYKPEPRKTTASGPTSKNSGPRKPAAPTLTKTLDFRLEGAHDFAFVASKRFMVASDTCLLPSGRVVQVSAHFPREAEALWKEAIRYGKEALRFYAAEVGDYPYQTLSLVSAYGEEGSGMEYPGLALIAPVATVRDLDITIAHEVGHNWFYGALGSNERDHPWLDEGLNTYFEKAYTALRYPPQPALEEIAFQAMARKGLDQPITTTSEAFSPENYALVAYHKTAAWLALVKQEIGTAHFSSAMKGYYQTWKGRHPEPKDLAAAFAPYLGEKRDFIMGLLDQKGLLPNQKLQGTSLLSPLYPKGIRNYLQKPTRNTVIISPAVGYNRYDGVMAGALVSNWSPIPAPLQYLVAPLYGTASRSLNGVGRVAYTAYGAGRFQKIEAALSALSFSKRSSLDSNGKKVFERFSRFTPSLRLTWKEEPLSKRERAIEGRLIAIREADFSSFVTKVEDNLSYVAGSSRNSRLISQLTFTERNDRALYPYDYALQVQEAAGSYRASFTGHYFFNYAKGGGATVRLFGATFGYLNKAAESDFSTRIYQPKLLAPTGEEDYSYSNYFVGRTASYANEGGVTPNAGSAAQQIMIRDGGLKLRIDQYEFLQGRSDNWVAAINLTTTLPRTLLPLPIPVRLFFDAGTFAEAWERNPETSKVLYVGGLQVSVLKDIVHFYLPIVYSKDFRQYLQTLPEQNKLSKKITFSIDLHRLKAAHLFGKYYAH